MNYCDQHCQLERIIRRLMWAVAVVAAWRVARQLYQLRDEWPASYRPPR